jgi:flagellar hook-associated protein 1
MSGLFSSLNSTVMALSAHSRAIETSGKNLANVNNAAYARQRILYGDRGTIVTADGAESLGLEALGIEQMRDELLDRQVMRESALTASFTAEQEGYQRAQAALGQSIDRSTSASAGESGGRGIAAAIDDFFNAFQSFAARPTDIGERQSLLQKSGVLTDRFQLADQRLAQTQSDLDAQITSDATAVNSLLASLAELNGQISRFEVNVPGSAVDLRDQRQAKLEVLATKISFDLRDGGNGRLQIVGHDSSGGDVMLLDHTQVAGPVAFDGTAIAGGSPAVALDLTGGAIHGALLARDGAVQTLRDNLDQLARQFVASVNAAYNPSGASGDFFRAAGTTAGTLRLDETLTAANLKASEGGAAGDNRIAAAIADLASHSFTTGAGDHLNGTFNAFFSDTVSRLGEALAGANARVDDQNNIANLVRSQRDGVSGVSLDEELADLMKFQRAFQASSRVFGVIDELLDGVVNRLGGG